MSRTADRVTEQMMDEMLKKLSEWPSPFQDCIYYVLKATECFVDWRKDNQPLCQPPVEANSPLAFVPQAESGHIGQRKKIKSELDAASTSNVSKIRRPQERGKYVTTPKKRKVCYDKEGTNPEGEPHCPTRKERSATTSGVHESQRPLKRILGTRTKTRTKTHAAEDTGSGGNGKSNKSPTALALYDKGKLKKKYCENLKHFVIEIRNIRINTKSFKRVMDVLTPEDYDHAEDVQKLVGKLPVKRKEVENLFDNLKEALRSEILRI